MLSITMHACRIQKAYGSARPLPNGSEWRVAISEQFCLEGSAPALPKAPKLGFPEVRPANNPHFNALFF